MMFMAKLGRLFSYVFLFISLLIAPQVFAEQDSAAAGPITWIEVSGTINPGSADYIRTSIRQSEKMKAQALIFVLDTPGGLLSSTREIIQSFSSSTVPVVLYVSPGGASATSAGAILSVASHVSAMAPGTNIGAAHPVGPSGQDVKGDMGDKVTNDTAAMVRAQADLRGRNKDIAEQVVTKSLSLTADEAKAQKLVDFVARDMQDLLAQLNQRDVRINESATVKLNTEDIQAHQLVNIPMSISQKFLHFVADPNISTALLALAGVAIYVEVSSGFSLIIPGLVGLFLALLGGVSLSMLPINLAGLLLFIFGLVLFIAEIFVTSFGLLFIGGLVSTFLGAMFLVNTSEAHIQVSLTVIGPLLLGIAVVMAMIAWLFKKEKTANKNAADPLFASSGEIESVAGDGTSGKIAIMGELWDFISDEKLSVKDKVQVIDRKNMQLKVKKGN